MPNRLDVQRRSLCSVERGLYAVRYRSANYGPAPFAHLRVVAGPVTLVTAPGRTSSHLESCGDVVVLVADGPGIVEIRLDLAASGPLPEVSFSLDLLDRGEEGGEGPERPAAMPLLGPGDGGVSGRLFEIEAHVARMGDVRVLPGAWISGPDSPLPIEGLTVLEKRCSLGLELQVRSAGGSGGWSPWTGAGQFAGTRQRAEHLTGVRIKLNEADRSGRVIDAEALFLGASVVRKQGGFVEFSSDDPLVGLKLDLPQGVVSELAARSGQGRRVQVFKAQ